MNSRQLAQVGLGLIGVWALLTSLTYLASLSAVVGGGEPPGPVMLFVGVPAALLLGLSYWLVFHNARLAATIAPDTESTSAHGAADLSRVLVVLLGVYLLVIAIPSLLNAVMTFIAAGEYPVAPSTGGPVRYLLGSGVQAAIALFLIFRPERLLAFARRPTPAASE